MDYKLKEDAVEYFFERVKYFTLPSEKNNYTSKFLQSNVLLFCVVLLLVLKIFTVAGYINFPNNIFFADITKAALEDLANQTRQSAGLPALTQNAKLDQAAQLKAENMVADNYFAHTSPTGISPWYWFSQAGYKYKYAGENLAIGFFDSDQVYQAWLNSPEHKANILNPNYTEVGTAVLSGFGSNNTIVVVQDFGSQKIIAAPVTPVVPAAPVATTKPVVQNTANSLNVNNPPVNVEKQVLAQTTEIKTSRAVVNYEDVLQNIIYGFSFVVMGILLAAIFSNFDFKFRKAFVIRSAVVVVLLSLAAMIPHQIII